LILSFNLIAVDREADYRTANIIIDLNKRSELNVKDYEIAILTAVAIDGDPVDSTETDFEIDVIRILVIFIFVYNIDIYQIS
jgi:hypothetical protein